MFTILGSIVNKIGQELYEPKNLHFENEEDVCMSSEDYEESGYSLHLHLVTISY